jgi:hypothetical protein
MLACKAYARKLTLVSLAVVLLLGVSCSAAETPEEAYNGYDEALADGAIERGWIPEWLPETAVDIREKHDLDSNTSILAFDSGESFVVPENCQAATETPKASLSASWWPDSEVSELPIYDCGDGLLAVEEAGVRVYYWRP